MEKIRIGKDFEVEWAILTNGEAVSLEGRDLSVEMHTPTRKTFDIPFTINGNYIRMRVFPNLQIRLGIYSFTLWENKGKRGQTMVDSGEAFQLVDSTLKEGIGCGGCSNMEIQHIKLDSSNMTFSPIVIGSTVVVDKELSTISENPVQNKVVTTAIQALDAENDEIAQDVSEVEDKVEDISQKIEDITSGTISWVEVI